MAQMTLAGIFDQAPPEQKKGGEVDYAALENYALLYTAAAKGTNSGIRFMMTTADAQKWCSLPESSGNTIGAPWAYFWTTVARFLSRDEAQGVMLDELDLRGVYDDGSWDERIAAAGCVKISLHEIPAILRPLGVVVLTKGAAQ